jgi:hypothetical protein
VVLRSAQGLIKEEGLSCRTRHEKSPGRWWRSLGPGAATARLQGSGHFVTVASTAACKRVPGQAVHAATKSAVRGSVDVGETLVRPTVQP